MGSLSILFRQCSYPVISHEDTNGASSLSFFVLLSSSVVSMQAFGVDRNLSSFQMFSHAGAPLNHPPLAIHVYLEC